MPFSRANAEMEMTMRPLRAFTLIELLVVIAMIAILMGLAFPVFQSIQYQAKKTQAKNDVTQIVTAVNAFYTEYGKYPITPAADAVLPGDAAQEDLMDALRATGGTLNPRGIVFISPPAAKDTSNPRAGIANRAFYDPWSKQYFIAIDGNYDNVIAAAKHGYADLTDVRTGVICWSYGLDGSQGKKISGDKKFTGSDDVISWQ
jgi:prepilin-type N-terminal cleavage/methylation domain-containing protein